jgi:hypothetical protein
MKRLFPIFILSSTVLLSSGQPAPEQKGLQAITRDVLEAQMGFLASDWMEGREAGEKGGFISSGYIASVLELNGVKPAGDYITQGSSASGQAERSFFQNFTIFRKEPGPEQVLKIKTLDGNMLKTASFRLNVDYSIRTPGTDLEIDAPVVFAGYGYKNDKLKYNDLSNIDVKGKFILRIAGVPLFARKNLSTSDFNVYYYDLENYAKNMGAAGIIEFNPVPGSLISTFKKDLNLSPSENKQSSGWKADFSLPERKKADRLPRITISYAVAAEIFGGLDEQLQEYISKADANKSFNIPVLQGKSLYIRSELVSTPVSVRNVIGMIEGNNPGEVIVLGAHYDHIGMRNGFIWNGADDNASGTVGVMTLAKAFAETGRKPDKTIVFALWTAEELGFLGSQYFIDKNTFPVNNLRLNLNFDMISRYISDDQPNKAVMSYSDSHPEFRKITEENLKKLNLALDLEYISAKTPPGGSDHLTFVEAGVPVMRFKPGHREEYHTPKDDITTIDWDIMEKIIKISFADIWELANSGW